MVQCSTRLAFALTLPLLASAGCDPASTDDGDAPVSDYAALFDGAPGNDALPFDIKADGPAPALHSELLAVQSPVKSQGKRGVCSIFSTVGLMEHLYLVAGADAPDFSEQYLQWSAKFEVGSFPDSSGSNSYYNLQAINRFGIPAESAWAYEAAQWDETDDAECGADNEDKPTRCYTNGAPPQAALDAEKFSLPQGRYINSARASIIDHIRVSETGVVVGLDFFYQSWNHRLSDLPRNLDYWADGIVLYPNATDIELSHEKRAGHSILIVGWDNDLEIPIVDAEGEFIAGDDGELLTETGFFIFKNSWGTGSFGADNPNGAGYGYLSMRYVEEFGWARTANAPELDIVPDEGGSEDDGAIDGDEAETLWSTEVIAIPDNDPAGARSEIEVTADGEATRVTVSVNITHTWRRDLVIRLVKDDLIVTLQENGGGNEDDLVATFEVDDFEGITKAGTWALVVADTTDADTGSIESWSLTL